MNILNYIETNPLVIGISSIINSIGVRLIWEDFDISDRQWIYNSDFKKIVIFTVLLVTTRNILISVLLFSLYMIIFQYDYLMSVLTNSKKYNKNIHSNELFN